MRKNFDHDMLYSKWPLCHMDLKFSAHTYFLMRNSNLNSVSTENQHEILMKFGKCIIIGQGIMCNKVLQCFDLNLIATFTMVGQFGNIWGSMVPTVTKFIFNNILYEVWSPCIFLKKTYYFLSVYVKGIRKVLSGVYIENNYVNCRGKFIHFLIIVTDLASLLKLSLMIEGLE